MHIAEVTQRHLCPRWRIFGGLSLYASMLQAAGLARPVGGHCITAGDYAAPLHIGCVGKRVEGQTGGHIRDVSFRDGRVR